MVHSANSRSSRHGISLVEVSVSTLLVGLVLAAALQGLGVVVRTWQVSESNSQAQAVAEYLLAEILQQRYEEPDETPVLGRESNENTPDRSNWDDIDDYHGLNSAPAYRDGTSIAGYENWLTQVKVAWVSVADPTAEAASDQSLKQIVVVVTRPDGRHTTRTALRSRWGALQQLPEADTTAHTWLGCEVTTGDGDYQRATLLPNHVEDR